MGGVHERPAAARDHVLDGAAVDPYRIALVVVDVAPYRGDIVMRGIAHDVVDRAAVLDVAGMVLGIHVQGGAGDEDLGNVSLGHLTQPPALLGVDRPQESGVDPYDAHRSGVDGPVRPRLEGLLGGSGAHLPCPGEALFVGRARRVPQQRPQPRSRQPARWGLR